MKFYRITEIPHERPSLKFAIYPLQITCGTQKFPKLEETFLGMDLNWF